MIKKPHHAYNSNYHGDDFRQKLGWLQSVSALRVTMPTLPIWPKALTLNLQWAKNP